MNFYFPYILTFLATLTFTYLLASYSFIHHDLTELFNISKTQFGFTYGVSQFVSAIGCLVYFKDTPKIKSNVVTYYTWALLGFCFSYGLILIAAILFQHPHKIFLYISVVGFGYFRPYLFTSILIMMKIHKQKASSYQISQNKYKFMMTFWCSKYDLGFAVGFLMANLLKYVLSYDWKIVLFLAILLNILTLIPLYIYLKQYLSEQNNKINNETQNIVPKIQCNTESIQQQNSQEAKMINLKTLLTLIKQDDRCKMFLTNVIILDMIHIMAGMIFPPYFFEVGYAGNEGQLLVLFSLSMVFGTWMLALIELYVNKWIKQKKQIQQRLLDGHRNQLQHRQKDGYQGELQEENHFPYISTIFLFLFFLSSFVFLINSYRTNENGLKDKKDYNRDLMLMCLVGFFYGGPAQNYINYHILKIVNQMEVKYKINLNKNNQIRPNEIKQLGKLTRISQQQSSFLKDILNTSYEIGSALLSFLLVVDFLVAIPFFIISFFIIEYYIHQLFLLLTLMAIITVVLDYKLNVSQEQIVDEVQMKQLKQIKYMKQNQY